MLKKLMAACCVLGLVFSGVACSGSDEVEDDLQIEEPSEEEFEEAEAFMEEAEEEEELPVAEEPEAEEAEEYAEEDAEEDEE